MTNPDYFWPELVALPITAETGAMKAKVLAPKLVQAARECSTSLIDAFRDKKWLLRDSSVADATFNELMLEMFFVAFHYLNAIPFEEPDRKYKIERTAFQCALTEEVVTEIAKEVPELIGSDTARSAFFQDLYSRQIEYSRYDADFNLHGFCVIPVFARRIAGILGVQGEPEWLAKTVGGVFIALVRRIHAAEMFFPFEPWEPDGVYMSDEDFHYVMMSGNRFTRPPKTRKKKKRKTEDSIFENVWGLVKSVWKLVAFVLVSFLPDKKDKP